ncbi:MAG: serine/threonine phosphatase [Chroococcidiopsidaceae cyanobacterium CP_BM_RX_35]|nr:serine/threonine phosphatase [Chroococcidiopsidaceae cyanobacterium CP_BM_RX_35]
MLICPHCQSENPNSNKYCQRCGTSLTQKVCPNCGSNVDLRARLCQNCGKVTGTLWWAIITPLKSGSIREDMTDLSLEAAEATTSVAISKSMPSSVTTLNLGDVENNPVEVPGEGTPPVSITGDRQTASVPHPEVYLDVEQRYQLLEPLPPLLAEVQMRVLDCQPLQLSPLAAALAVSPPEWLVTSPDASTQGNACGGFGTMDRGTREPRPNHLNSRAQAQTQLPEVETDSVITMAIPAAAKPYLALLSQFPQTCAAIHDAWQEENRQVVLIEDRSDWPQLLELWHERETTSAQILPWLYKMTQLWAALEPWHCRPSLLISSNLRVTADKALALQRLYIEPEAAPTLQDLGRVWQELFHESQRTQFGALVQLIDELKAGYIQTLEELQSRLAALTNELQVTLPTSPASPALISSGAPTSLQLDELPDKQMQSDDMSTVLLPMQLYSLEDAGCTDVGRQRDHNEDCFGIETTISRQESPKGRTIQARGLYILCDGMGGHAAGEVASALAVKTLQQYFQTQWQSPQLPDEATIREAVRVANQAIYNQNQEGTRSGTGRMGTTLVMVLFQDTKIAVAHVGDSRVYRLSRRQGLEQLTVDHEVGQREISRGVEPAIAYGRPDAYQLTQALGPRDEHSVKPDVKFLELNEDTLLLLTSDGLCDNDLLEQNWQTHLKPLLSSSSSLEQGASNLIDLANQYNGHDNITAVLIRAKVRPDMQQQQQG